MKSCPRKATQHPAVRLRLCGPVLPLDTSKWPVVKEKVALRNRSREPNSPNSSTIPKLLSERAIRSRLTGEKTLPELPARRHAVAAHGNLGQAEDTGDFFRPHLLQIPEDEDDLLPPAQYSHAAEQLLRQVRALNLLCQGGPSAS